MRQLDDGASPPKGEPGVITRRSARVAERGASQGGHLRRISLASLASPRRIASPRIREALASPQGGHLLRIASPPQHSPEHCLFQDRRMSICGR
eukprot:115386-Chlamydomonas_euryale.AAC.3